MFRHEVYKIVSQIPVGYVLSYGQVATLAGYPGAARAVGTAMKCNPTLGLNTVNKVPCHRVVCASGDIGNYVKGKHAKKRLLINEGVQIINGKIGDKFFWKMNDN